MPLRCHSDLKEWGTWGTSPVGTLSKPGALKGLSTSRQRAFPSFQAASLHFSDPRTHGLVGYPSPSAVWRKIPLRVEVCCACDVQKVGALWRGSVWCVARYTCASFFECLATRFYQLEAPELELTDSGINQAHIRHIKSTKYNY